MFTRLSIVVLLAAAGFGTLADTPALAQATRTWVSGVGDDVNPCSRTAPCKTFAGAISKTQAGGEINCLDPGGFGAVTITKSIAIYCEGVIGGVLAASTNGVIINAAATDVVTLHGLDIEGTVQSTGLNGIRFLAGAALHVEHCLIRNFRSASPNGFGILFAPSTAGAELYVDDTLLSGSGNGTGGGGIGIQPTGSGTAKVVLSQVRSTNNTVGFRADSTAAANTINVSIADSNISGNTFNGVVANAVAGTGVQVLIDRTVISNNANVGIRGDGSASTVRLANSVVSGNAVGTQFTASATLSSYFNNFIDGNTNNGPNPPTIPQK